MSQNAITVKATISATEAENALVSGRWEEAKEKYILAANLYKTAISQSEDPQTLQSLKQMYEFYLSKAKQIEEYLESTNSIPLTQEEEDESDDELFTEPLTFDKQTILSPTPDVSFSKDPIAFVTRTLESNRYQQNSGNISSLFDGHSERSSYSPTSKSETTNLDSENRLATFQQTEPSGLTFEKLFWKGIEKLLDLLPKPSKRSKTEGTFHRDNSLDTSFFMMSTDSKTSLVNLSDTQPQNQTPSSKSSTPLTTNQPSVPSPLTSPISASSSSSSSTSLTKTQRELELEKEVQRLQNIIKCLKQQNANLLKRANATGMQSLLQENTQLKRSIILFRNEVKKKASQFQSNVKNVEVRSATSPIPVTGLSHPDTTSPTQTFSGTNSEMHRIQALESALRTLQHKLNETESQLQKYKKRWEELKANARKRRELKSTATIGLSSELTTSSSSSLSINKDSTETKQTELK